MSAKASIKMIDLFSFVCEDILRLRHRTQLSIYLYTHIHKVSNTYQKIQQQQNKEIKMYNNRRTHTMCVLIAYDKKKKC